MSVLVLSTIEDVCLEDAYRIGSILDRLVVGMSNQGQFEQLRKGCKTAGGHVTGLKVKLDPQYQAEVRSQLAACNTYPQEAKHYDAMQTCDLLDPPVHNGDIILLMPGAPVTAQIGFLKAWAWTNLREYKCQFIIYDKGHTHLNLWNYVRDPKIIYTTDVKMVLESLL